MTTRVLFYADVDDELAQRLDRRELTLAVTPAADSAVLAAAEPAMLRHRAPARGAAGEIYREHCLYWLRAAADTARREGS